MTCGAVGRSWAARLRIFGQALEFIVRYENETASRADRPGMSMAEHMRFEGERIAEIEVFQGRSIGSATSS